MYRGFAIAAATISACTLIVYAVGTSAQETQPCPNGEVYITADTRAQATAAGIPPSSLCWNPSSQYLGQNVAQAKQDLAQMRCGSNVNIDQLDSKFAQCADKFMQQLRQSSPSACIESAYRSVQQQLAACMSICGQSSCPGRCAPPGSSYHQKGLAIDISKVTIPLPQFWNLALQSGIGNPTGLHKSDPNHIQAMNGGANCATLGYQPTDSDSFAPGPISNNPYFNYNPNPLPSMTQPSLPQSSLGTPTTPTISQQQCAPQFSCVAGTIYLQTTSCTQQIYQQCQYGCSGTVCLPNPAATTTSPIIGTTYPIVVPTTSPALTMLEQFTKPVGTTTATATPATVQLNSVIYNVITATGSSTGTPQQNTQAHPSPDYSGVQTFTSGNLSQSSYSLTPSVSSLLQNLASVLTNLLSYLRSIGR